jgi:AsmA-like C-terminal region
VESLFPAPLVASWVESDLFPILRSGDVQLESFLIDGHILQLKNLEFPENTSALSMGFDCRNFTVHGDRLREPLRDVSAKVSLKDGVLLVSELKGVSGKSEIKDGRIEVRDIYLPHPAFEPWVRGSFDLEDVLYQCKSSFLPAGIREAAEKTESVSGIIEGQARFKYDPLMECPEIIEADFLLHEGAFKQKQWLFPLLLREGRIRVGEENHFQASGSWGASSFDAEGNFSLQGLSIDPRWMEVEARLDLGQVWPALSHDESPVVIKGSALCKSSIKKDGDLWSFKGTARSSDLSVDHEFFRIDPPGKGDLLTFDVDIVPEQQIHIGHLLWEIGESQLNLAGDYPLSAESDITLQCSAPGLSLDDLGLQLKPQGSRPRGSLKGTLEAKVPKNDFSAAAVSGEMQAENLAFQVASLPSPVRECDFRALLSGDKIVIPSFTLTTGESSLEGNGELKGWRGLKGALTVTSSSLNVSDFVSRGKERREKRERSLFVDNTDIRVSLLAQPVQWKKWDFEKLKADLLFRKGDFHIADSEIQIDRGLLEIRGYVKEDAMAFSGHVDFKDQPMEPLLKRLGIEPLYEGSLTMEARLYTEGKEWSDLISHMDGGTNILVSKGTIRKSNVFLKVLEFLSLQNIFTKRPPDLSKEGLYFESLGGHGEIEQGVVHTENAQMKSPVLNAVATGSADLGQGLADFDLGVQPLGTIDTVVSNIPVLGHILTGENKSLITYYFEVKGPILNPQVEAVPFKALGNGVTGILKRLFLSPVKVFEDILDGIKKLPAPEDGQSPAGQHSGF